MLIHKPATLSRVTDARTCRGYPGCKRYTYSLRYLANSISSFFSFCGFDATITGAACILSRHDCRYTCNHATSATKSLLSNSRIFPRAGALSIVPMPHSPELPVLIAKWYCQHFKPCVIGLLELLLAYCLLKRWWRNQSRACVWFYVLCNSWCRTS